MTIVISIVSMKRNWYTESYVNCLCDYAYCESILSDLWCLIFAKFFCYNLNCLLLCFCRKIEQKKSRKSAKIEQKRKTNFQSKIPKVFEKLCKRLRYSYTLSDNVSATNYVVFYVRNKFTGNYSEFLCQSNHCDSDDLWIYQHNFV